MSDLRKAAQMALEAFVDIARQPEGDEQSAQSVAKEAIIHLRAALAQPEPEPVAWRWTESNGKRWFEWRTDWTHHDRVKEIGFHVRAKELGFHVEYAYPAPPQRKPLTDQEIIEAIKHISHNEMSAFAIARAIENVLKNAPNEADKGTYDNP